MLRKIVASGILMSSLSSAFAQDSTATPGGLTVSGSADLYYRYDFGKAKANNLTSFTNSHNSFELGMASVKLDFKTSKVEMVADLGFGKRATEFSYNDAGILAAIKQLYISYSLKPWLKLTAGSWATHVGYEVVDAYANANYSMSYMFTNGPFFHTGLKAEATYKSNGFMIGIANPNDFKTVPDGVINEKFLIAQYSYAPSDRFKAFLNYAGGKNIDTSSSNQFDVVLQSKLNSKFSLAFNGTWNSTHKYLGNSKYDEYKNWWGSAAYIKFEPSSTLGLALREEYFSDEDQLKMYGYMSKGGSIWATTLSLNLKADHFTFIPELRLDKASETLFIDADKQASKTAASILFAAIYNF
jgi:hypothetical protein